MSKLPWLLAGACLLVALAAGVYAWRADGAEAKALERAATAEAGRLAAEGLTVQATRRAADLEADLQAASDAWGEERTGRNVIASELARAKRAAPDARVVEVVSAHTDPAPATGTPREDASIDGAKQEAHSAACLLRAGDPMDIRLIEPRLRTELGNVILVGAAQCRRLLPEPVTVLHEGALRYDLAAKAPDPAPSTSCWTSAAVACAVCGAAGTAGGVYVGRR